MDQEERSPIVRQVPKLGPGMVSSEDELKAILIQLLGQTTVRITLPIFLNTVGEAWQHWHRDCNR